VSEEEYWELYYEEADHSYEWNNGYLEEKGVSDYATMLMYEWFFKLLDHFLTVHPIAKKTFLEMGFRLALPLQTQIRRPDLGVVRVDNPVPLRDNDRRYRGIFDMCIEALSDSSRQELERDTVTKKAEYAASGVKEYFMLYAQGEPMAFYRLTPQGVYVPIKPVKGDIIQSQVLPGFQFRRLDLYNRPSAEEMSEDRLYQAFVLPALQAAKREAAAAANRAQAAETQVVAEKIARLAAEAEIARLKALLANLGK
jgi:hypothetical protein